MSNQREVVLNFLSYPNSSLTARQASNLLGIDRLAARILELRDEGHNIHTERVEVSTGKRVGRYTLLPPAKTLLA